MPLTDALLPPWAFMWSLAFTIFLVCKVLTFRQAVLDGVSASPARSVAYLLAWPGMDAPAFLQPQTHPPSPVPRQCISAILKTLAGAALIWVLVPRLPQPILAGWLGMLGLIFLLHFGLFHILALLWQRAGVCARPIMRNPLRSHSLSDFWGRRWNLGFHQLAHGFVFRPLAASLGQPGATLAVFFASGLLHELVISVPAGGGYGLPTAYFLLQGLAVLFERSRSGLSLGLNRGARGWLFMFLCTAGPAYWLFHPPFVSKIILPFLQFLGAR